nr:MAG TPA: Baseplate J like protein [Caudoviricetes sp.]
MTYETIMRTMMEDMPDDIDTSEGSLIFNACAKQAVRLEEAYLLLAGLEQNMYTDTADLEHLIRNGNDRGCYINQATYAEFTAQFNCPVPAGSRWNLDEYNYTVFNVISEENHTYRLGCDTPGAEPNHVMGDLDPIEYVEGFEWGKIIKCTLEGTDQEETETYRARVMATYNYRGFAGNREYYKSRLKELSGVYGCKLERVSAPSDRIKATIIGQDYRTPSEEVISAAQTAVDPIVNSGEGEGFAPIGHRVTVIGVKETVVNIETTITCESGYSPEALKSYINQAVDNYLLSLRKKWEDSKTIIVRILQIEAALINITGILDVAGTKINGAEKNLQITDGSVPVKGEITCT